MTTTVTARTTVTAHVKRANRCRLTQAYAPNAYVGLAAATRFAAQEVTPSEARRLAKLLSDAGMGVTSTNSTKPQVTSLHQQQ